MGYLIALGAFFAIYLFIYLRMDTMKNIKLFNFLFFLFVYIPYLWLVVIVYLDVGFDDWNFRNTLPTANVSPFMFSIAPFALIFPKRINKYLRMLIALLCVGMFFSSVVSCIYYYSINYKFHPHFLLDFTAHFALSLWGIYLVKTRQVELNRKDCLIGGGIIVAVATIMLTLNVIFDTAFFGLSLNGKHSIYNNVIVENSYLSALLYYFGLIFVLFLGFVLHNTAHNNRKKIS